MTAHDVLNRLRAAASSKQQRGELFERLVRAYLRLDGYYGALFSDVWRWTDWPGRRREHDLGIDLVAKERDSGKLWAIQTKFHEDKLDLNDISSFIALSGRGEFSARMLVTTSSLGRNAEQALQGQEKPVVVLTLFDLVQSPMDWSSLDWANPEELRKQPRKQLFPFQQDAVDSVMIGFSHSARGKLIMPPGSGKTFVALRTAERMVPTGGIVLFLAPSIALVDQTLRAWLSDNEVPLRVFAVTSDYTVASVGDSLERTTMLSVPPTTNAEDLSSVASVPSSNAITVIISTYHSIGVVAEAQRLGLPAFDLVVADEAHRTTGVLTGSEASYYQNVHSEGFLKAARRLYMTATPRVFVPKVKEKLEEQGYDYFTMDDESIYGEEL